MIAPGTDNEPDLINLFRRFDAADTIRSASRAVFKWTPIVTTSDSLLVMGIL